MSVLGHKDDVITAIAAGINHHVYERIANLPPRISSHIKRQFSDGMTWRYIAILDCLPVVTINHTLYFHLDGHDRDEIRYMDA